MAILSAAEVRAAAARTGSVTPFNGYTDADIEDLVDEFRGTAERYLGYAQEPTTVTETIDLPSPAAEVLLGWALVRSVTSVTVNGSVLAAATYRAKLASGLLVRRSGRWNPIYPPTVVYVHGLTTPTAGIRRACALYVTSVAVAERSGMSRDIITQGIDGGTTRYSTPSFDDGRPTGWLEVDRLINAEPRRRIPGIG